LSAKPETTFYQSVIRHLPPESQLHREKMSNPYRGGTADTWLSGSKADLWIEWKFIKLPVRDETRITIDLSALQREWLRCRHLEGRNVWVVVGCKEGGVLMQYPNAWASAWKTETFKVNLQTRQSIAAAIKEHCL